VSANPVMSGGAAQFVAFLQRQAEDYRSGLPNRLKEVERLWALIEHAAAHGEDWMELERQAHNIAGTGGTFGLARLSESARALERLVQEVRHAAADMTDQQRHAIRAAVQALRASA
jgi:chemotaxis protein histidine kinase CheA